MKKAVITGDIVRSTLMTAEHKKELYQLLSRFLKQLNRDYKIKSEMYRGDSFQCLVETPYDALRVALLIKTHIRSLNPSEIVDVIKRNSGVQKSIMRTKFIFDARIAIGIGEVDQLLPKLANSDGVAFQLSGYLLDEMKNRKEYLGIETDDSFNEELKTELFLLDTIISRTTALQCEVINWKLLGHTEMKIAKNIGIDQSAVNQRSVNGNWNAINAMLERFEVIYSNAD